MRIKRKLGVILIFILMVSVEAWATHIRAGEITAVRISQTGFRYRFTIVIYTDTRSNIRSADAAIINFGQGTIYDGTTAPGNNSRDFLESLDIDGRFEVESVVTDVEKTTMEYIVSFNAPGVYCISYTETNRNANVLNINGGASEQSPFHIETVLRIDPFLDNGTPVLTSPPIDRGCIGYRFLHNPAAFDPDGDSLAYKLVTPLQERDFDVPNFQALNDPAISNMREDGGAPGLYQIDSITGDFVWDAPMRAGEYNAAFIVEEWRYSDLLGKFVLLGYVTRDMQILVEDCENERPELIIPDDLCVEAGTLINEQIVGRDPDNDQVLIEGFGGPFELTNSPAEIRPFEVFRRSPSTVNFEWLTNINHVREKPYEVVFKISDSPADPDVPALTNFETWKVTVVAPAPEGLNGAILDARSIQLVWDEYIGKDFNPVIQVWRKEDTFDFTPEDCELGIPANSGYELIDEVPVGQLSYVDDKNIRPGVNYCYRLVARFPRPRGGESYASIETCVLIPLDVPAITNVSVIETDEANGEIDVNWTEPLEIDQALFPPPYRYELIRYTGLTGQSNRTLITSTGDLSFRDTNINTSVNPYHYRIVFYDAGDNLIDSSAVASSVRAEALGLLQSVELSWRAEVPWSNRVQDFPYHFIFRNRTDAAAEDVTTFVKIDSVRVTDTGFLLLDEGQFNGIPLFDDREYCYFVTTQGSYGNPLIGDPLLNNSQIVCVQPNDNVPPTDPVIEVVDPVDPIIIDGNPVVVLDNPNCSVFANVSCNFNDYSNTLNWTATDVDGDIAGYRIYFSPTGSEGTFNLVGNSRETSFTHTGLSSFKGCYRVSSVDRSNNESGLSDPVCFDNCPSYELPNAFSPNEDGVNETFTAFDRPNTQCPRFVQNVQFKVFNRWGGSEIFTFDSNDPENTILINWDGRDNNGKELPAGTYYYSAIVTFDVFNPDLKTQEFKNWVKIIR